VRRAAAVALLIVMAGTGQASAATKVVNFDDRAAGTEVSNQ
jgi:hypothetical protein